MAVERTGHGGWEDGRLLPIGPTARRLDRIGSTGLGPTGPRPRVHSAGPRRPSASSKPNRWARTNRWFVGPGAGPGSTEGSSFQAGSLEFGPLEAPSTGLAPGGRSTEASSTRPPPLLGGRAVASTRFSGAFDSLSTRAARMLASTGVDGSRIGLVIRFVWRQPPLDAVWLWLHPIWSGALIPSDGPGPVRMRLGRVGLESGSSPPSFASLCSGRFPSGAPSG